MSSEAGVSETLESDVIVVGSGNAALCAAISASEAGASVLVVEAGGEADFGGNSRYTAGAMRFAYRGEDELAPLLANCDDPRLSRCVFGSYPREAFAADLSRFNDGAPLTPRQAQLIDESYGVMAWLSSLGLELEPIFSRQAFEKDGALHFWGGLCLAAKGEGPGLVGTQRSLAAAVGVRFRLGSRALDLDCCDGGVTGLRLEEGTRLSARAVVLACGGFEADPELRAAHLGEEWRAAVVRGTPWNRGDGLRMAVAVGAARAGSYAGCHAVCMDTATPSFVDSEIPHLARKNFRKISYPFGVMLNARGERFVDEGADFRNYTYAQYGREVLRQPGGFAWQIFDAQVESLLYEEYRQVGATRVKADSLQELVRKLGGVDPRNALDTLAEYNAATGDIRGFDPTRKDGVATEGLALEKRNWALPLRTPPFQAFRVTCGITFTYGGLAVDRNGAVLGRSGEPVPGLYAAGELVGGLFRSGYPGGSGLTAGAVFGRAAGRAAAAFAGRAD